MREAVRIAGAGLAGLTAALGLARAGYPVDVYESKTRFLPSSGPHTEAIRNYRAVDALEDLHKVGFDIRPFSTVQRTFRYSPRFRNVLYGPAHYLFMRGREDYTVDQALLRLAKASGVTFHFGKSLDISKADVVATGPPKDRYNILGAGYTFSAEGSSLDRTSAYGLFDDNVAPGGYLVVTPGVEFHSIYSVSWTELRFERLLAMTESAFDIPWIRNILGTSRWVGKIHGRAYYVRDPIQTAERDGVLYVGEAGGFQDAVAGFGFRYAVLTGGLSARAIVGGEDYRELLRRTFGKEFEEAFDFRARLNLASNDDYDQMITSLGPEMSLQDYVSRREPRGF